MNALDRLSAQWNLTRADVVRRLIRDFDKAVREVREEACRVCSRLAAAYLFESMLLNPMVVYHLINANRDVVGDRDFIVGWVVTTDHRVFFSHADDLGRWLLRQAREYVKKYYEEEKGVGARNRQVAAKPPARAGAPTPKASTGGSCYKIVVKYPDGEARDAAEILNRGCRDEGIIEISPEEYKGYLRNETSLDELIEKHRGAGGAQTAASSGAGDTQAQPQPSTQQVAQPQANTKPNQPNPPYWTLGEAAMRLGLLKLPKIINKEDATKGDP